MNARTNQLTAAGERHEGPTADAHERADGRVGRAPRRGVCRPGHAPDSAASTGGERA